MKSRITFSAAVIFLSVFVVYAQDKRTAEERMESGDAVSTSIGGYGNVLFQRDITNRNSTVTLQRVVFFIGHQFSSSLSFLSELEVEDAKVKGGEDGGEVAFEQAYLQFTLDRRHRLAAGLLIPRIGIINDDHLPTTFYGNERPQVERYIIPSTWRELGVGFYGSYDTWNFGFALLNGLNSAEFKKGSGIRGGRFEGREASANNLAVTGSIQWRQSGLKAQASGYYGGSTGLSSNIADTLGLASGFFGSPVALAEANAEYNSGGWRARVLGVVVSISDAFAINRAYGNNTPKTELGAYAELGYDLFSRQVESPAQSLIAFARFEWMDLNAAVPANAIRDASLDQTHVVVGFSYYPDPGVVIKADMRFMHASSGTDNSFLNLGFGFAF